MKAKEIHVSVQVFFERDGEGFHAYAPALKGCHVGGETLEEARSAIQEAVRLHLKSLLKHGDPIPVGCFVESHAAPTTASEQCMATLPSMMPFVSLEAPSVESLDLKVPVPA